MTDNSQPTNADLLAVMTEFKKRNDEDHERNQEAIKAVAKGLEDARRVSADNSTAIAEVKVGMGALKETVGELSGRVNWLVRGLFGVFVFGVMSAIILSVIRGMM